VIDPDRRQLEGGPLYESFNPCQLGDQTWEARVDVYYGFPFATIFARKRGLPTHCAANRLGSARMGSSEKDLYAFSVTPRV
jgi:hypothetical protein